MEVARFERRIFSYIIDLILPIAIGIGSSVLLIVFSVIPWYFDILLGILSFYIFYLLINIPIMCLSQGKTIGCYIFRIQTVSTDGQPIAPHNVVIKQLNLGLIPLVIINAIYMLVVHTEYTLIDKMTDSVSTDIKNVNFNKNS